MAGLSIGRRRKAWITGVACGASGHGRCNLLVPALKAIFQRGFQYGQLNPNAPDVKAAVAREEERATPRQAPEGNRNARRAPARGFRRDDPPRRNDSPRRDDFPRRNDFPRRDDSPPRRDGFRGSTFRPNDRGTR